MLVMNNWTICIKNCKNLFAIILLIDFIKGTMD